MVACTFTPIAVAALDGTTLTLGLASIWSMATGGILLKAVSREPRTGLSVGLQLAMGWLAVVWPPQFYQRLGLLAVGLIALGGFCYTLGVVVLATRRPGLYPRSFSYRELFHLLVVAGSASHFARGPPLRDPRDRLRSGDQPEGSLDRCAHTASTSSTPVGSRAVRFS